MSNDPQTSAHAQRGRIPPTSQVLAKGPGKYRLEFSVFTRKEPHQFEADGDEEALKYAAKHLSIGYPFSARTFRSTGARGVYCEGREEPVFR